MLSATKQIIQIIKTMKIYCSYSGVTDKYIASITYEGKDIILSEENGIDLVDAVKKQTGIVISYNPQRRTFDIPLEYQY